MSAYLPKRTLWRRFVWNIILKMIELPPGGSLDIAVAKKNAMDALYALHNALEEQERENV